MVYVFICFKNICVESILNKKEFHTKEEINFSIIVKNKCNMYIPYIAIYQYENTKRLKNIVDVKGKKERTLQNHICFHNRGIRKLGISKIEVKDLFGVITLNKKANISYDVIIYPRLLHFKKESDNKNQKNSQIYFKYKNNDSDCEIKKYQNGDKIKDINWKVTAKLNEVYINKHNDKIISDSFIILDMNKANCDFDLNGYAEETLIESALSIVYILQNRNTVSNVFLLKENLEKYTVKNIHDYNKLKYAMVLKKSDGNVNVENFIDYYSTNNNISLFTLNLTEELINNIMKITKNKCKINVYCYKEFSGIIELPKNITIFNIKEIFKEVALDEVTDETFK